MKLGQVITYKRTGQKGVFLRTNPRDLSIELWDVQLDGDAHETTISPTLLIEGQFKGCHH